MQSPAYLEPNQNHTIASLLRWLRNAQDDNCLTARDMASCKRNVAALQALLEHGANADVRNNRGQTPLHVASQLNFSDVMQLLLLLKHDANPDAQNHNNMTLLHVASYKRNYGHTAPARV
jgi:ankyrin repeat protein